MEHVQVTTHREPWNKGKIVGQRAPLKLRDIWALRVRLQMAKRVRELALFNLGIDSKLRGCDLVKLKVRDVCHGDQVAARAIVMQQKTKHPEVTLQVLRGTGAQCGTGAPPTILKAYPAERFCKLPGGEICVYGLADALRMTQLTPSDWQALVQAVPAAGGAAGAGSAPAGSPGQALAFGVCLMLLGVVIGLMLRRER